MTLALPGGALSVHLQIFPIKIKPPNFFLRPGGVPPGYAYDHMHYILLQCEAKKLHHSIFAINLANLSILEQ